MIGEFHADPWRQEFGQLPEGDLRGRCARLAYEFVPVDITKGEAKTLAFLQMNDMAQVPVVDLQATGARLVAVERDPALASRAARGFCPRMPIFRRRSTNCCSGSSTATSLTWRYAATRWSTSANPPKRATPRRRQARARRRSISWKPALRGRAFFVGGDSSIADIALLAYTRLAHEGGFDDRSAEVFPHGFQPASACSPCRPRG